MKILTAKFSLNISAQVYQLQTLVDKENETAGLVGNERLVLRTFINTMTVTGRAQSIMFLIGAVAAHGDDHLISVKNQ